VEDGSRLRSHRLILIGVVSVTWLAAVGGALLSLAPVGFVLPAWRARTTKPLHMATTIS